jgi:hypothetical protein
MKNPLPCFKLFAWFFLTAAALASMNQVLPKGTEPANHHNQNALFIFRGIEPALRRDSAVPPRLPAFLPDVDADHPIYPVIQSAGRSGYDIVLATVLPCEGQNNCLYGTLRGSTTPISVDGDPGVPIMLHGRVKGQYIKSVCHAFCTESFVKWREKGFFYSVGIKAEKKADVIKAANSAIAIAR